MQILFRLNLVADFISKLLHFAEKQRKVKNYRIQHDININEGIIAIKFNMFMLQREIITVTDVFEKYNICKDCFLYFITLYEDDFLSSWNLFFT